MMFFDDICEDVSKNEELVKVLLLLLNSSDSPTLVQVVRLVHVCVVNKKARRAWLNSFREIGSFVGTLQFILGNSLNVDLLKGTLQVVYYILHASDEFSLQFGSSEFIKALTAGAKQLRLKEDFEALDEYWHVLHLLSLNEDILKILGEFFHSVYKLLHVYVSKLCDNEDVVPSYERTGALAAGFATLVSLLTPERLNEELFDRDRDFLSCLKTMLKSVQKKILVYKKQTSLEQSENSATSQKDTEDDVNETVKESKNIKKSINEKTDAQSTDVTSSLEILEDSLSQLCVIIIPSIKQEDEVKKALLEALKVCAKSSSQGATSKNFSPSV
ncbi:protein SAAL1-like [Limulus polyphemus]|uniref:Protein SAAL1-like n=1 Tax=Limulus polyphemus TaxID=6850 RepID=A0ABM1BJZ8_LIMPO|nr:protein SAAL1-like [Limulus polyphemus]